MSDSINEKILNKIDISSLDTNSNFTKLFEHFKDRDIVSNMFENNFSVTKYEPPKVIPIDRISAEEQRKYNREQLSYLQQISENTASISALVDLVAINTEKQELIIDIITEILSIASSKTNEEAESKFKNIMKKITDSMENVETIQKLIMFTTTVYNIAKPYIDKAIELIPKG